MTDLYKVKPLVWEQDEDGDWVAGGYYIRQFGASYGWGEIPYSISNHGLTLEAAQSAVEAHHRQQLTQYLEPVPGMVLENLRQIASRANAALAQVERADG